MTTIATTLRQNPPAASTTVAAASDLQELNGSPKTITVASTTGFPAAGSFSVLSTDGPQAVAYTAKTGTTFTGCTGGSGQIQSGSTVGVVATSSAQGGQQPSAPVINVGLDVAPGSDYTAGGYGWTPGAQLQKYCKYDKAPFNVAVVSEKKLVSGHVYEWSYDRVNDKLMIIKDGANDNGTGDLSAIGVIGILIMSK